MNLNDMPITMDEPTTQAPNNPPQPTHAVHHTLIDTLLSQFTAHIDMLVETKFNALVKNRNALALLDVAMKIQVVDLITEAMDHHESSNTHLDKDDIEQLAADQARETLSEYAERQEGWVTKDQVNDLITEHVDAELDMIDWDEKVKDVLRDML